MNGIRLRFAPSPTGNLHVGGARTSFYNYLLAKKFKGTFVLRIEDTDEMRSTKESEEVLYRELSWLGMEPDESPLKPGPFSPYRQSERKQIYQKYASELLLSKKAFHCFCNDEDLQIKAEKAKQDKQQVHYDGTCKNLTQKEIDDKISAGIPFSIRMVAPQKDYSYHDLIRGDITFPSGMIGDFVIIRSNGLPVYNFCCVIDDHLMKIDTVIRAEEHLSNTLRQLIVYEALTWKPSNFAHVSILINKDGSKLSKRDGSTSVHEFREKGYLKEALLNFLILLGWTHPKEKEILSLDEMIDSFSIEKCHKSPACFEITKLIFLNAHYIKEIKDYHERMRIYIRNYLPQINETKITDGMLDVVRNNLKTLEEVKDWAPIFYDSELAPDEEAISFLKTPEKEIILPLLLELFPDKISDVQHADQLEKEVLLKSGLKGKVFFKTMRSLITAKGSGPDLKQILVHLPTDVRKARLNGFKNI